MSTIKDVTSSCLRVPFSLQDKICRFKSQDYEDFIRVLDILDCKIKIFFSNGCFDLFHSGHAALLLEVKDLLLTTNDSNNIFIIGLNSDKSVSNIKGADRPKISEFDRAFILASYPWVTKVVIFDEDTPAELLDDLKPDVVVKGRGYEKNKVISNNADTVLILDSIVTGLSTTEIVKKL